MGSRFLSPAGVLAQREAAAKSHAQKVLAKRTANAKPLRRALLGKSEMGGSARFGLHNKPAPGRVKVNTWVAVENQAKFSELFKGRPKDWFIATRLILALKDSYTGPISEIVLKIAQEHRGKALVFEGATSEEIKVIPFAEAERTGKLRGKGSYNVINYAAVRLVLEKLQKAGLVKKTKVR
jgi:hypothetical protein